MLRQEVVQQAIELPFAVVPRPRRGVRETVLAYLSLTKPRIISLLLITTVPAMIVAKRGMPSIGLIALTLVGGALAAGGANTINCYLDRDIDGIMARTRKRPLPAGSISPEAALLFGIGLGIAAFEVLAIGVNLLSAALAMAALAFYVLVYTVWLKRSSAQNIVIGGAAGAMPPLVGWAAVRGSLDWPVLVLFGIIFLWTPPHFWALALRYRSDYAEAGVPMLPVVRGEAETNRQILLYSVLLVAVSVLLAPVAGMGWLYLASATLLGVLFLWFALRQWREARPATSKALFSYSLLYLALLYVSMGLDRFVAR